MRIHRATVHPARVLAPSLQLKRWQEALEYCNSALAITSPSHPLAKYKLFVRQAGAAVSCGACSSQRVFSREGWQHARLAPCCAGWAAWQQMPHRQAAASPASAVQCAAQALIVHCTLLCTLHTVVQAGACVPGSGPPAGGPGRFRGVRGSSRAGGQHPAQAGGRQVSGQPALHRAACRFA